MLLCQNYLKIVPWGLVSALICLMRILGIDFGEKRIGVAISDELCLIAQPLMTILRTGGGKEIDEIKKIVHDYNVYRIVIGLPLRFNGRESTMSQKSMMFGEQIKKATGINIEYYDERLTTKEIDRRMIEAGVRRQKRKKDADKFAACVILQSFLCANKSKTPLERAEL